MPTAAIQLVRTLCQLGVDRAFCVPGESYLPALDALASESALALVTCRHESGAGLMAVTDAKLTGRPGVAFVSRGPGATNAALAVHTAEQDAAPLVLFIGQLPRRNLARGVFQNVDYGRMFGGMAKQVIEVQDGRDLAGTVVQAFRTAVEDTPGPVVVSIPEDVLEDEVGDPTPDLTPIATRSPPPDQVADVARRLRTAQRPLFVVGGGAQSAAGRAALATCAARWHVRIATSYKHQDLFDNEHRCFAGHLGFGLPPEAWEHLTEADLIVAVGTRLDEITTQGFRLPTAPVPKQPLVHVYPDAAQIGRVFDTAVGIISHAIPFLDALAAQAPEAREATPPVARWGARLHAAVERLAAWNPPAAAPADGVDFGHVVTAIGTHLPGDGIVTADAGNFSSWLHRHFRFRSTQRLVSAISGAMGLGVPAAVVAALRYPTRQVVGLVGDGGFLMTGSELATAVQYGARVRLFVANNGSYGTIRLHQEKQFPGRVAGTTLTNPDFAALGVAYGVRGLTIDDAGQADAVVRAALDHDGPVVIDVRTSLERLSAFSTLSGLAAATRP